MYINFKYGTEKHQYIVIELIQQFLTYNWDVEKEHGNKMASTIYVT